MRYAERTIPENHPIHDPYTSLRQPGQQEQALTLQMFQVEQPELRIEVPKRRYAVGEPIWATLTMGNPSKRNAIRLSPPYIGQHVATAGVWRAQWDWLRGGQFVGPLEVIPLNKGRSPWPPAAASYGGVPIVLKPGETYTTVVPLNVAQQVEPVLWDDGPQLAWFAGMGLTEPGLYRLYVQYANIENLVPFGTDLNRQVLLEMRELKHGDPSNLAFEAIVPKPVEVEIVPPRMKAWDETHQQVDLHRYLNMLRQWEPAVLETKDDMIGLPSLEELPAVLDSLHESEVAIRQSLVLTRLRVSFSAIDPREERYRANVENVLKDTVESRTQVEPGPMADAYDLTICHMLRALGREDEAVALAQKLNNPDAAVFLVSAPQKQE
jgi:hypothetical protein